MEVLPKIKMPERIAELDRDRRGYPIPWNVLRGTDGTPFFTVNDSERTLQAIREERCPICGQRLGAWRWLAGGPRCAFDPHGAYLDLPSHKECVEFALQTCPYLALPKYLGRIDVPDPSKLPPQVKALVLEKSVLDDRPEIFVAVSSARIELVIDDDPFAAPLFKPHQPYRDWTCWRHGRQITEAEAMPYLHASLGADWNPPERA